MPDVMTPGNDPAAGSGRRRAPHIRISGHRRTLALAVLLFTCAGLSLGPAFGVLFRERQLAEELKTASRSPRFARADDAALRRSVQTMARVQGFHIEVRDVVIVYAPGSASRPGAPGALSAEALVPASPRGQASGIQSPVRVGYTLPLLLPFFGVFEVPLMAVRLFDLGSP